MAFVTFDMYVSDTMENMSHDFKITRYPETFYNNIDLYGEITIPKIKLEGYDIDEVNKRIKKISNYSWTQKQWKEAHDLAMYHAYIGAYDLQRLIVMAAWDQMKGQNPKFSTQSFFFLSGGKKIP